MNQHQKEYNTKFFATERTLLLDVLDLISAHELQPNVVQKLAGIATRSVRDYRDVALSMSLDIANSEPIDWTKSETKKEPKFYPNPDDERLIDHPALDLSGLSMIARELAVALYEAYGSDNAIVTSDDLFKQVSGKIGRVKDIQKAVTEIINTCAERLHGDKFPRGHRAFFFYEK